MALMITTIFARKEDLSSPYNHRSTEFHNIHPTPCALRVARCPLPQLPSRPPSLPPPQDAPPCNPPCALHRQRPLCRSMLHHIFRDLAADGPLSPRPLHTPENQTTIPQLPAQFPHKTPPTPPPAHHQLLNPLPLPIMKIPFDKNPPTPPP